VEAGVVSRRAASFTQADVHRVLKAAQQAGPDWQVLIEGSTIRLTRSAPSVTTAPVKEAVPQEEDVPPEQKWEF
jgi:hypothetical protein